MTSFNNKALSIILQPFRARRQRVQFNPNNPISPEEKTDVATRLEIFKYGESEVTHYSPETLVECMFPISRHQVSWLNVDGLKKKEVTEIATYYHIHPLLVEDILSKGQRAKADNMDTQLFCLIPMIRYNKDIGTLEVEQLSLILGDHFVISFQEEPLHDPFGGIRNKLNSNDINLRKKNADYLFYALIDAVVDQYFNVLDHLVARLEKLEDEVVLRHENDSLIKITLLRREIMIVKRVIGPVREVINYFLTTENKLIDKANKKYFKDVYDHILLAIEYTENYRDMITSLQDLNMNKVDMKMNEVMKILTVVTTLLAPATVIGGIFGMNFDKIPYAHHPYGFYIAVGMMLVIAFLMLLYFKKKKWF